MSVDNYVFTRKGRFNHFVFEQINFFLLPSQPPSQELKIPNGSEKKPSKANSSAEGEPSPEKRPSEKTQHHRKHRQTVRLYVEKEGSVELDIARLKGCMERIILGDPVTLDECQSFKNLFKLDNGRRVLCFLLKEYSEFGAEGGPFLISFSSFEMLKELISLVLRYLCLSDGADFISGKLLLECSSLIARESRTGGEVEFIQTMIKPHQCWRNTFFWEEYFWGQVSPKFEEVTLESLEQEHAFFSVEIFEFVKRMWGWGSLSAHSIVLFAEALAAKSDLSPSETNTVVKLVEDWCIKQMARSAERQYRETNLFMKRRTTALTPQQVQEWSTMGAEFESCSENFKNQQEEKRGSRGVTLRGRPQQPSQGAKGGTSPTRARAPVPRPGRPVPQVVAGPSNPVPSSMTRSSSALLKNERTSVVMPEHIPLSRRKMIAKTVSLNTNTTSFIDGLLMGAKANFTF
eukprot:TRINITY_DN9536_c0_g1_i5.p1 TRINITY_DN9536_c0_g1~~TRINITY_DN9536_c0_g1_i5.p1  ORF type:complete len:460 (+),score=101.67 TRINITY_DN9536_c0_g1_i5:84-1463(+)